MVEDNIQMKEIGQLKEPSYDHVIDVYRKHGFARLGLMVNQGWHDDPKRIMFSMARYKFVSKMLSGFQRVLEIGCGDSFCSRLVKQEVAHLSVTDFDPILIENAKSNMVDPWIFNAFVHDILSGPVEGTFDAIYSLDVMEHITINDEDTYLNNIKKSLNEHGVVIIGMPSLESQVYGSNYSRAGHVNCKTGSDLKSALERHFHNVFLFSMNDEVVHTGFSKMAHYLFVLCCGKRM